MGTVIGIIVIVVIVLGVVGEGAWLLTSRSFPRSQTTAPDLAAFTTKQQEEEKDADR